MNHYTFDHLVLLIGTNPLPNFVVADYFLKMNEHLRTIWLVHSDKNERIYQASTNPQAENLEELLRNRWKGQHQSLQFPLQKISLSDASNAKVIRQEIETKMLPQIQQSNRFHFDYTGGTKSMSTQIYWLLKNQQKSEIQTFSYLDARNFRLLSDDGKIIQDTLRERIAMTFKELIELHGFQRYNEDRTTHYEQAAQEIWERINNDRSFKNFNGYLFEDYIAGKLQEKLNGRVDIFQNWQIQKTGWGSNNFELDVLLMYGYHLIGISCTVAKPKRGAKEEWKKRGFEVILRTRQIGGDEAKAVLLLGETDNSTIEELKQELCIDTGSDPRNILIIGKEHIIQDTFSEEIEKFIFGK